MTNIDVNEKYRIVLDTHSWAIHKRIKYKGVLSWRPVAWLTTIEQACEWLLEQSLRESDIQGALEVKNAVGSFSAALRATIEASCCQNNWLDEKNRLSEA